MGNQPKQSNPTTRRLTLLPSSGDGRVPLEQYLTLGPRLPEEHQLTYQGFLSQYSAVEPTTTNAITITLTNQQMEEGQLPVIFDIEARREFGAQPEDWDKLRDVILSLRRLRRSRTVISHLIG